MNEKKLPLNIILKTLVAIILFSSGMHKVSAQHEGFGIGVILGEPVGISGKVWTSETKAFDGAVAWSFVGNGALYLHSDYLWHSLDLIEVEKGLLPVYYGGGARFLIGDDTKFGIRGVAGMAYLFDSSPVDIFLEIGPIFDFIPAVGFTMSGGIGVRYYLGD